MLLLLIKAALLALNEEKSLIYGRLSRFTFVLDYLNNFVAFKPWRW